MKWLIDDSKRELNRAIRVANELTDLVRRDATLFKRIKPRTLRWIKKQDQLALEALDAKDEAIRIIKRKKIALAKLTKKEKALLGLLNLEEEE
jgi:hypothetical protein